MGHMAETDPGYFSLEEAKAFSGLPIGTERKLTIFEEGDMLIVAGENRGKIADLTPEKLREQADLAADHSKNFVGC